MERTQAFFSERKIRGLDFLTASRIIFVSVGTDPQPFDRLLKEVDRLAEKGILGKRVFCQTGYSNYKPLHAQSKAFLDSLSFEKKIREADLVILHGGAGAIGTALQHHKTCIVMPRLFRFGEHANDHQLELVNHLGKNGFVLVAQNEKELEGCVKKAADWKPRGFEAAKRTIALLDEFVRKAFG